MAVTSSMRLLARRYAARRMRAGRPSCRRRDGCGADLSMEGMSILFPVPTLVCAPAKAGWFVESFTACQRCYVPRQRPVGWLFRTLYMYFAHFDVYMYFQQGYCVLLHVVPVMSMDRRGARGPRSGILHFYMCNGTKSEPMYHYFHTLVRRSSSRPYYAKLLLGHRYIILLF